MGFKWFVKGTTAFAKVAKEIHSRGEFCGTNGLKSYVQNSALPDAKYIAVARNDDTHELEGFGLLYPTCANVLHLDVLCAHGVGRSLLRYIERRARAAEFQVLKLHALPYVIGFYRHMGYHHANRCGSEAAELKSKWDELKRTRFTTDSYALRNKTYRKYLQELVKRRLVGEQCRGVSNCSDYGFRMIKRL